MPFKQYVLVAYVTGKSDLDRDELAKTAHEVLALGLLSVDTDAVRVYDANMLQSVGTSKPVSYRETLLDNVD